MQSVVSQGHASLYKGLSTDIMRVFDHFASFIQKTSAKFLIQRKRRLKEAATVLREPGGVKVIQL